MLITLKSLLHTLLLPPGGPLLLAIAGACLIARRGAVVRSRRVGWTLLSCGLATLWLLAIPLVANALSRAVQRCPALEWRSRPVQAQAIVILGGSSQRLNMPEYGGEPAASQELLEKVNYAAFLARRTSLPVAVSGARDETLAMRASLARDFQLETRWVENRSRDTFENAQFCAELLKPSGITRIVLVTSADHEWRAMHEFVSAGFSVVPAPIGLDLPPVVSLGSFVPNVDALSRSSTALYELLGDPARQALDILHLRRHKR
jgi:uncharacterized SAM-binding protein YcdF (DUF218 family)